MKRNLVFAVFFTLPFLLTAQVGIGTTNPQGALDITSATMGLVIPRVSSVEAVTDGSGGSALNGTLVYDELREKMCSRINDRWVCTGITASGTITTEEEVPLDFTTCDYFKASNAGTSDQFGNGISLSGDGIYLAVGAIEEDSNATGVNGDQTNNSASRSGAVYLFVKSGSTWTQQAYIKASNTGSNDFFGTALSLNSDGTRLVVGAANEDSNATGVNGDGTNNSAFDSGAAYVFVRSGSTWTQEAYLKASNTEILDNFGGSVAISGDGTRIVIGATQEDSNATGIGGDETNNTLFESGAAYVFLRTGTTWAQEAYIKASNTGDSDSFGFAVSISNDGSRMAIGAQNESSNATGINGNQADNSANGSGAVYVYSRSGTTWSQEAYIKASNTGAGDIFGSALDLSSDSMRLAVGAFSEDSNATGINGDEANDTSFSAGAAYVFVRSGTTWSQEAYIKASNTDSGDLFGISIAINNDGSGVIIGANGEDGYSSGLDGDQTTNTINFSGAAYLFQRSGSTWTQEHYIKACNVDTNDSFGVEVAIDNTASYYMVGSVNEDSSATGINGDMMDNSRSGSGAVYGYNN